MHRPSVVRARAGALGLLVALVLGGCGGADEPVAERPSRSGRTHGVDVWYAVAPGPTADTVVLTFDGPGGAPGTECEPDREAVVEVRPDRLVATVRRYAPSPVVTCPTATTTIEARLPEPLGDRPLESAELGWRFVARDGGYQLDPESTPCAREDCSAPARVAASCGPEDFDGIVSEQLGDRRATASVRHCDGSFLVVDKGKLGWFVNKQAAWQLVATGEQSCDDVHRRTRIRFPEPACAVPASGTSAR